jgi:ribosomal protein S18 acetylase RimI-like enzyme
MFGHPAIPHPTDRPTRLRVQQVLGSPGELTTEVLRLFVLYPHHRAYFTALGTHPEEMAALLCHRLPEPGAALFVADDGRRLQGLVYLEPDLWASALLGHYIWKVEHLVTAPSAPESTALLLLEYARGHMDGPVDFLLSRPPASDAVAIRGLRQEGFRVVGGEAVGVVSNHQGQPPEPSGISVVPLRPEHLDAVFEIANACHACSPYTGDPAFGPERIAALYRRKMSRCLNELECGTLVAVDAGGQVLGAAGYGTHEGMERFLSHRLASLDFIAVDPRRRGVGLSKLLIRHVLGQLHGQGIRVVCARTMMTGSGPLTELAALHQAGFSITHSNLVMHRWKGASQTPP